MSRANELLNFVEQVGGVATSAMLLKEGFSAGLIAHLHEIGKLEKETRGVYVLPGIFLDDFATLALRWRQCVFSYGSALYLLKMSDRMPTRLEVTVARSYNIQTIKAENPHLQIYRSERDLLDLGRIEVPSPSGVLVPCYNSERCICDLIKARERSRVDLQLFHSALNEYFKRPDKDVLKLNHYAKLLHVEKELHRYTEVLQ